MELYRHQREALEKCEGRNRVAFYHDMGLGKTFTGAEKMVRLGAKINLVICQKSKVDDWVEHFKNYYNIVPFDLTKNGRIESFMNWNEGNQSKYIHIPQCVAVINYDLAWRRAELLKLKNFTLMLDESSMIQNERAKRSKFILKLDPANVILLSGTPTGGKYERLWSQMRLLGWDISRSLYWSQYVNVKYLDTMGGRSIPIVTGYKNVDRLKRKMAAYGCQFLKSDEVFDLPEQTFTKIFIGTNKYYKQFRKSSVVEIPKASTKVQYIGDTTLTKMLYERQLCGIESEEKLKAFSDLMESTNDRLIVFYNFTLELDRMTAICKAIERPYSVVNGSVKDLSNYDAKDDSVTFVQYQAGAMGLNLQKANKVIYFTLPLSSELFEQSKKRIHRIGQHRACFYYLLICKNSIEGKILKALEMRKDYTEKLFERGE